MCIKKHTKKVEYKKTCAVRLYKKKSLRCITIRYCSLHIYLVDKRCAGRGALVFTNVIFVQIVVGRLLDIASRPTCLYFENKFRTNCKMYRAKDVVFYCQHVHVTELFEGHGSYMHFNSG